MAKSHFSKTIFSLSEGSTLQNKKVYLTVPIYCLNYHFKTRKSTVSSIKSNVQLHIYIESEMLFIFLGGIQEEKFCCLD